MNYAAGTIIKRCNSITYYEPHCATAVLPRIEMMSIILLLPVAISTDRSTDRPCALDMCNTARSFTHESNTCVIRRLAFLNLGFIERMSCTPLPATLYNLASQNSGLSTDLCTLVLCTVYLHLEREPNRHALKCYRYINPRRARR